MKITKEQAIRIFDKLEFKTANQWDEKRLQNRINDLPNLIGQDVEAKSKLGKLGAKVLRKLKSGKKVIVISSETNVEEEVKTESEASETMSKKETNEKKIEKKSEKKTIKKEK